MPIANGKQVVLFLPTEDGPLMKVAPAARLEGHAGPVRFVSRYPVANVPFSCSSDGSVKLWACLSQDVQEGVDSSGRDERVTWSCIHTLDGEHSRTVRHVSWSPSGGSLRVPRLIAL
ncbi:WD domain [Trypanosoma vivax]|nr:WD domain [Trypanosoma vivax]